MCESKKPLDLGLDLAELEEEQELEDLAAEAMEALEDAELEMEARA